MSQFNYSQYQEVVNRAQSAPTGNSVKIGFFKLKNDGDEALVRFNVASLSELSFATVHQLGAAQRWMKVSCLNEVGNYGDTCPLCKAVAAGNGKIGKAAKRVYVQMLVSYKDATTNQFSEAVPVIWERPAGFSREIANLLRDYGNLKEHVFKITRNGAAGNMQTTYTSSCIPLYDKPEAVPTDFSAFDNFKINKHSYWEKTAEEIETFLKTGEFPDGGNNGGNGGAQMTAPIAQQSQAPVSAAPTTPTPAAQPAPTTPIPAQQPAAQPTQTADATSERPARKFTGFSF